MTSFYLPLGPDEKLYCTGSKHIKYQEECAYCHGKKWGGNAKSGPNRLSWMLREPPVVLHCKDFPQGTWEFLWNDTDETRTSIYMCRNGCLCGRADSCPSLGYLVLHRRCFADINGTDVSPKRIDRLGRALASMDSESIRFVDAKVLRAMPDALDFRHDSISYMGHRLGLPLGNLPLETLRRIQSYCQDAPFWERVKALDFRCRLMAMPRTRRLSVRLGDVVQWTRGTDSPVLPSSTTSSRLVRITFDKRGLYQIEQLSSPRICMAKHPFRRFIVLELDRCEAIIADFKDGTCCLWSWSSCDPWRHITPVWDILLPPMMYLPGPYRRPIGFLSGHSDRQSCSITKMMYPHSTIKTISLDGVCGLTFSFPWHQVFATAHDNPVALKQEGHREASYMPLAPNDRILWIQLRHHNNGYSAVVKTELSGIVHLGRQARGSIEIKAFSEAPQAIFCYGPEGDLEPPVCTPEKSEVVTIYPKSNPSPGHEAFEFARIGPPIPHLTTSSNSYGPIWSWAPLEDIACVCVFQEGYDSSFLGAHITYKNGGQRFAGNPLRCRYAIEMRTENPNQIHVGARNNQVPHVYEGIGQRVEFVGGELEGTAMVPTVGLVGELHSWHNFASGNYHCEVRILPSGSWRGGH